MCFLEVVALHASENGLCFSFTKKCDDNATCTYLLSAASCWLDIRVKVIAGKWHKHKSSIWLPKWNFVLQWLSYILSGKKTWILTKQNIQSAEVRLLRQISGNLKIIKCVYVCVLLIIATKTTKTRLKRCPVCSTLTFQRCSSCHIMQVIVALMWCQVIIVQKFF
jgi:hypothetical protein